MPNKCCAERRPYLQSNLHERVDRLKSIEHSHLKKDKYSSTTWHAIKFRYECCYGGFCSERHLVPRMAACHYTVQTVDSLKALYESHAKRPRQSCRPDDVHDITGKHCSNLKPDWKHRCARSGLGMQQCLPVISCTPSGSTDAQGFRIMLHLR